MRSLSGKSCRHADRPTDLLPPPESLPDPLPGWAVEAQMRKGLSEHELAPLGLTAEEAKHLANISFMLRVDLTRDEARAELFTALEQYRASSQE